MTELVFYILLFLVVAVVFFFFHMLLGKIIRPSRVEENKLTIYECGEPTVGSAWIQFDLRYYVVALLFVVFDVEVAFFFPWAVVFGKANELSRGSGDQAAITAQLTPSLPPIVPGADEGPIKPSTAKSWAWIAFADLLVFFGVLMVGFAYLWKRGDIDWVRTLAAEKTNVPGPAELPVKLETPLAG